MNIRSIAQQYVFDHAGVLLNTNNQHIFQKNIWLASLSTDQIHKVIQTILDFLKQLKIN